MSERHFAVISEALRAVKTADQAAVERLFDPAVEWHNTSAFPGERVWKGPRGVIAFWQMLTEDVQDRGSHEIEHYAESYDRAVVGFHSWGSGRASGFPVDVRWAAVFELRDERVTRVDVYGSYARASQAIELRA
jgi:ketosteroid isomerase-like protein